MVFCSKSCSDLLSQKIVLVIEKKLLKFKAQGQDFKNITRGVYKNVKRLGQFLK